MDAKVSIHAKGLLQENKSKTVCSRRLRGASLCPPRLVFDLRPPIDGKDLIKNGRNSAGNQQYFCKHCRAYFTETKNTPLYNSRLGRYKVEQIFRLSQEKISIRGISRVTGHHPATIIRYFRLAGEHAALLTSHFLQNLGSDRIEMDEFWAFVKKNKHCEGPYDQSCGDRWTYTAIRSTTKLMIAHHSGKRTDETCNHFIYLCSLRLQIPRPPARISIATDGNPQYLTTLLKHIPKSSIDYGRVIKQHKENRVVAIIREESPGQPDTRLDLNICCRGV